MTTEPTIECLEATRGGLHERCVVCGRAGPAGLGLEFRVEPDGRIVADFAAGEAFEGYGGMLHGGVISAIADGAMTNCLFAHGIAAVTGELTVRFRHPVQADRSLCVSAMLVEASEPLYHVQAEIIQDGVVKATAKGKFMQSPGGKQP
ncbi:MAG: PaaI family thioesterase [Planctomycetes bacterium]|jgi:acyl-coenzyme A thioesterase PaaI-like protein|nr:PaaI family thioesterase [Planctomycetota bacterium]